MSLVANKLSRCILRTQVIHTESRLVILWDILRAQSTYVNIDMYGSILERAISQELRFPPCVISNQACKHGGGFTLSAKEYITIHMLLFWQEATLVFSYVCISLGLVIICVYYTVCTIKGGIRQLLLVSSLLQSYVSILNKWDNLIQSVLP